MKMYSGLDPDRQTLPLLANAHDIELIWRYPFQSDNQLLCEWIVVVVWENCSYWDRFNLDLFRWLLAIKHKGSGFDFRFDSSDFHSWCQTKVFFPRKWPSLLISVGSIFRQAYLYYTCLSPSTGYKFSRLRIKVKIESTSMSKSNKIWSLMEFSVLVFMIQITQK